MPDTCCSGCQEVMTSQELDYNLCPGCDRLFCFTCEKNFTIEKDGDMDSSDDEAYLRYCDECSSEK